MTDDKAIAITLRHSVITFGGIVQTGLGAQTATRIEALTAEVEQIAKYRQAAYAAGLERAAVIAEESMVLLSLGEPEDGPFTRQDKAVDEARACIATAIRAEKDKT